MTEPRFSNREEFARWLEDKPSEWARVLALRAALRVAPLALDLGFIKEQALLSRLTGALQRAFSVGWGFAKIGPHPREKARSAADAANAAATYAADAAHAAAAAAAANAANAVGYAAYAAHAAAYAANSAADNDDIWQAVMIDAGRLADRGDPEDLLGEPIWQEMPVWFTESWGRAESALAEIQRYETFRLWFERRIRGRKDGYPFREGGEAEFFERLIKCDDEWWVRGPTAVDADIAEWLRELAPTTKSDPQDPTAPIFGIGETGKIGIEALRGNEELQKDAAAQRRHEKAKERIEKLRNAFRGNNNADAFAPIGDLIDESLGNSIDETEPQMLVLETQSLRDALEIQQEYGPSDDRDPLDGDALRIARDAVNAMNLLIGSDPFLEAIDTKLLGPDAVQPLPEPADIVALADVVRKADLTDADADRALRQAARNAPVPSDLNNRKTGFVVRFGLNLVRWTIDLVVNHENEISAAAAGGFAASLLTAGVVATGGTTLGALGLAWLLAKNVKDNEDKWRKIAESAKVTSQNFDLLMEKLNKLPLD